MQLLGYDFGPDRNSRQKLSELLDRSDHFILVVENAAGQLVGYAHACRYDCLYFSSLLNLLALVVAQIFKSGVWQKR